MRKILYLTFAVLCLTPALAQEDYSDHAKQTARLRELVSKHPQRAKLKSIAKTTSGKDIYMLTVSEGNTVKPAIAIVGGVEGNHLLGTELAIGFAEKVLASSSDSITQMLSNTTFYIFPNMSPDAMEQYFAKIKYERQGNASATDDDRDGKLNEDGFDDLDGNGKITMMRVQSPVGDHRINPNDPRGVIKADLVTGEKGSYILYTEGRDNDRDGKFNEDGEGGVWFNKSLTFKYQPFVQGSGEFAVSETETRALLDTLYQLFNVYAVVSFSSQNNLSEPIKFNSQQASQRVVASYLEPDAKVNSIVSELYNKTTNMKGAPKSSAAGGDFLSWAYYHYGRFSFSSPGWFVPKPKADTTKKEKPVSDSVIAYLNWAAQNGVPAAFTEWKKVVHPDFPGQVVEVGGIDPFVMINPPFSLTPEIINKHTNFIASLAQLQPKIDIQNIQTTKVSGGLTRITATIMNTGVLPSHTKLGERNFWVKRINIKLSTNKNQQVLSGKPIQLLESMEGLESKEMTWLVKGNGTVTIEAGSPTTGSKKVDVKL